MAFRRDWPVWSSRASTPTQQPTSTDPYDDAVRLFDHGPTIGDASTIENYWSDPGQNNSVRLWPVRKNPLLKVGVGVDWSPVGCLFRRPSNTSISVGHETTETRKTTVAEARADAANDHNLWNDGLRRFVRIGPNTLVTYAHYSSSGSKAEWLAESANSPGGVYNTVFFACRDGVVRHYELEPDVDLMDQCAAVSGAGTGAWWSAGVDLIEGNTDLVFFKFVETPPSTDLVSIANPFSWRFYANNNDREPVSIAGHALGNQNRIARCVAQTAAGVSQEIRDGDNPMYYEPIIVFATDSGTPVLRQTQSGPCFLGLAHSYATTSFNKNVGSGEVYDIINPSLVTLGRSSDILECVDYADFVEVHKTEISGPIRLKHSDTPGNAPASLEPGEIAINRADQRIYSTDELDTVKKNALVDLSSENQSLPGAAVYDPADNRVALEQFSPVGSRAALSWNSASNQWEATSTDQSYLMLIESPSAKTYMMDGRVAAARTITNFYVRTSSGNCVVALKNFATSPATLIGSETATVSGASASILANTSIAAGDRLGVDITNPSGNPGDLEIVVEYAQ